MTKMAVTKPELFPWRRLVWIPRATPTNAKNKLTNFTSVFILPPSGKALVDRLKKRGTDSKNSIYLRVQSAKEELSYINDFDYFIVNDQIEIAYTEMKHLVSHGRKPSLTKQEAILKCEEISRELSKYKYWVS